MTHGALQIVVTIWISLHPVTFTLPHIYYLAENEACEQQLGWLMLHRKHKRQRVEMVCTPTYRIAL